MIPYPEFFVDGEADIVDVGGVLKVQLTSSMYHPIQKKLVRQPACILTMTPQTFVAIINQGVAALQSKANPQGEAPADPAPSEAAPATA